MKAKTKPVARWLIVGMPLLVCAFAEKGLAEEVNLTVTASNAVSARITQEGVQPVNLAQAEGAFHGNWQIASDLQSGWFDDTIVLQLSYGGEALPWKLPMRLPLPPMKKIEKPAITLTITHTAITKCDEQSFNLAEKKTEEPDEIIKAMDVARQLYYLEGDDSCFKGWKLRAEQAWFRQASLLALKQASIRLDPIIDHIVDEDVRSNGKVFANFVAIQRRQLKVRALTVLHNAALYYGNNKQLDRAIEINTYLMGQLDGSTVLTDDFRKFESMKKETVKTELSDWQKREKSA